MAKWSTPVEIRIADLPRMQQFMNSAATLLKVLAECDDLPEQVIAAVDQIRRDAAALTGRATDG